MKFPDTYFEFISIVIPQYAQFKGITEEQVIELFNKHGIFQYLNTFFDILRDDKKLFWKIELRIKQSIEDEEEFQKQFDFPLDKE